MCWDKPCCVCLTEGIPEGARERGISQCVPRAVPERGSQTGWCVKSGIVREINRPWGEMTGGMFSTLFLHSLAYLRDWLSTKVCGSPDRLSHNFVL